MNKLKAISLFSGCGGDTLGMTMAGIDLVGYVEIDKNAILTHEENFPCTLIGTDITKIDDEKFKKYKNKIDIIFAGFPCQSFSHGGKKNSKDKRGFLYQEFIRCASIIKPKFVIGENVKGLITRKTDSGDLFLEKIISEFEEIGYKMNYHLFNMKDYGIPQDRQRIILYGIRDDVDITFDISLMPKSDIVTMKSILEKSLENTLLLEKKELLDIIPRKSLVKVEKKISDFNQDNIPTNLEKCYDTNQLSFGKRSKPTFGCIIDKNTVCRTILSTYCRMPRLFVPVSDSERQIFLRPFTIKELQRIQGFPDEFIFHGTHSQKITQIGNAIPPLFIKQVFDYILGILSGDIIEIQV